MTTVEDLVRERIAAARRRRALRRRQRAELDENRQHGLQARRAAKLARQQQEDGQ